MMELITYFKSLYDFYIIRRRLNKGKIITLKTLRISDCFLKHPDITVISLIAGKEIEDFQNKYKVCVTSTVVRGYVGDGFELNESTINIFLQKSNLKSVMCDRCYQMTTFSNNSMLCINCLNKL